MKTRLLSSAVGIILTLGIFYIGTKYSIVIDLSLTILSVMCLFEGLSANKLNKKLSIAIPCIMYSALVCMLYSYKLAVPILTFALIVSLFMAMIFNHEKIVLNDIAFAVLVTAMCTFGFWSVISVYDYYKGTVGIFYIFTVFATSWLADGGAYFGGSFLGKKKLCPKISPKKTVEGAVSGVLSGAVLVLLLPGLIFEKFIFEMESVNYIYLAIFGLIGALLSIVGDLSFSLIKRNCGIKDYGSLIPGHGGMLDRFDSVIFVTPLLVIFNIFLPIVNLVG